VSKSKARGTAAETAVVRWLAANGFPYAERRTLAGSADRGDLAGIPGVVAEIKNCRRDSLPSWVDEARVEAANAGVPVGVVIHKRVGTTDASRWFVTMDLATFAGLIR
jgi:hypothetical protein